jgi:hypothetical protein
MVIWIVFIAVEFDVDNYTHYTPQPAAAIPTESCGSFAGSGRAQLRSVAPIVTDARWQVVELAAYQPISSRSLSSQCRGRGFESLPFQRIESTRQWLAAGESLRTVSARGGRSLSVAMASSLRGVQARRRLECIGYP